MTSSKSIRTAADAAALLLLSLGALVAAVLVVAAPRDPSRGVAVIFAPWTTAASALTRAAAGARFVRFGGAPFVAIAVPDDETYAARMYAAGAWLIVDPQVVAACLSPFSQKARA
jgi:hypothetical protein